jgi:predicted nicotinamide N-methyase
VALSAPALFCWQTNAERRRLLLLSDLFYGKDMHQKHILATKNNSPNKSRRLLSALVCRQNTPAL